MIKIILNLVLMCIYFLIGILANPPDPIVWAAKRFAQNIPITTHGMVSYRNDIIYLSNHTNFSDFIIDTVSVPHASYLGLCMMSFLPFELLGVIANKLKIFYRDENTLMDHYHFNKWLDSLKGPLLAYPEGKFNRKGSRLNEIKRGLIKYAFTRNRPVQVMVSPNKHNVFNHFTETFSQDPVDVYFSDIIFPGKDFEDFYQKIVTAFNTGINS